MTIEKILANDFAALKARFVDDAFVADVAAKIKSADRFRLVVVGSAGAAGAAIAASQFSALVMAFSDAAPALTNLTAANEFAGYDFGAAPMLAAALLFAFLGGATALVLPGSR